MTIQKKRVKKAAPKKKTATKKLHKSLARHLPKLAEVLPHTAAALAKEAPKLAEESSFGEVMAEAWVNFIAFWVKEWKRLKRELGK
jgi:hypothetical protein